MPLQGFSGDRLSCNLNFEGMFRSARYRAPQRAASTPTPKSMVFGVLAFTLGAVGCFVWVECVDIADEFLKKRWDSIFGSTMERLDGPRACNPQSKALIHCLNNNEGDISQCQNYMDMLKRCRKSSA